MKPQQVLLSLAAVGSLAWSVTTANAGIYNYYDFDDLDNTYMNATPGQGVQTLQGVFDIVTPDQVTDPLNPPATIPDPADITGFNPLTMTINTARAYFGFTDTGFGGGQLTGYADVTLPVGEDTFVSPGVVSGIYGGDLDFDLVMSLNSTGQLTYQIAATSGDFYANWAELQVWVGNNFPTPVPDTGATLGMLGLGFLGLVTLRKRFGC